MGILIDVNYRNHDLDFYKGFGQSIITASTSCQTDEHKVIPSSLKDSIFEQ